MNITTRLSLRYVPDTQQYQVMTDNPVKSLSIPPAFRHAAVQRLLGILEMVLLRDAEGRSMPANVYPTFKDSETWVVEPPANDASAVVEPKTFTGHAALLQALQYAHSTYGSARYLSR